MIQATIGILIYLLYEALKIEGALWFYDWLMNKWNVHRKTVRLYKSIQQFYILTSGWFDVIIA